MNDKIRQSFQYILDECKGDIKLSRYDIEQVLRGQTTYIIERENEKNDREKEKMNHEMLVPAEKNNLAVVSLNSNNGDVITPDGIQLDEGDYTVSSATHLDSPFISEEDIRLPSKYEPIKEGNELKAPVKSNKKKKKSGSSVKSKGSSSK